MWGWTSGEHCRGIDKLAEEIMLIYSTSSVQAEVKYRQDRIKRDFQRPFWFQRKPRTVAPAPRKPELRARPAM
ncbi:hypothetical protein [Kribbella sp. CA-247076]|uniref:hypothetical protein n=1 Tax=Kribbella sp. CA-247076 TaxID=3239941 RepID=UPI003D8C4D01